MSRAALLVKEAVKVTEEFPEIAVDGEVMPLVAGAVVKFLGHNGWELKVEVKAFPEAPKDHSGFYFKKFERWSGNDKLAYDILPVKRLWVEGKQVHGVNGVAYSAERSEIVLLEPAQDKWGARLIASPIQYRTKGKSSSQGAPRKVASVEVSLPSQGEA